jgi:hypothetical protein
MNRKHNPMLSLAVKILLGVILALILAAVCGGCAASAEATAPMEPTETVETVLGRFSIEMQMKFYGTLYIITDNETGIQYLAFETGHGVGMTQLLPGEG